MSNDTVNFGKGKIVTDGLVLRLDANSPRSLIEGGDTYNWYDLSAGTAYDAVFKSGEDLIKASELLGTATDIQYFQFRTSGVAATETGYVHAEVPSGLRNEGVLKDENSSFTIEALFRPKYFLHTESGMPSSGAPIFGNTFHESGCKNQGLLTTGYGEDLGPGQDRGMLIRGTISSDSTTCFTDGIDKNVISGNVGIGEDWLHVTLSYDASTSDFKCYANGVSGQGVSTYPAVTEDFIGDHSANTGAFFIGGDHYKYGGNVDVSVISCYNRSLSSGEAYQNYQALKYRL
jgi:hypothetical protein